MKLSKQARELNDREIKLLAFLINALALFLLVLIGLMEFGSRIIP